MAFVRSSRLMSILAGRAASASAARKQAAKLRAKGDIAISIVTDPDPRQWAKQLGLLPKHFSDFKPAFKLLVPILARGHAANIRSKGALLGHPWPAADPGYARSKIAAGHGAAQFILSRRLLIEATRIGGRAIVTLTKRKLSVGIKNTRYARAVQFRRGYWFIGWNKSMKRKSQAIMTAHAEGLVRAAIEAAGGSK